MRTKTYTPSVLGLSAVDLKAANDTAYLSEILDLGEYKNLHVNGIVTETGTTNAGEAKLSLVRYADDKSTVLDTIDLLTGIVTTTSGVFSVIVGRDFAAAENGLGTIGAAVGLARVWRHIALKATVVTQADGTTCTLDVYLQASP